MFVYQDEKLYAKIDDKLVGVSATPTGIISTKYTTKYKDGQVLTLDEVNRKFGIYQGKVLMFPEEKKKVDIEVGDKNGAVGVVKKTTKSTGRKSK